MTDSGLLKPLPRRAWMADIARGPANPRLRSDQAADAPLALVLLRSFAWQRAGVRYAFARAVDRVKGRTSDKQRGVRLRRFFEEIGGAGVKIGQQMAMRLDFLPYDVCRELDRLLDDMAPFPLARAIETIEESLGAPWTTAFAHIDEKPVGSASIACVWQATLHSGERVAVKVRRPEAERLFSADLALLDAFTSTLELITAVRPGFFRNLRSEIREMFASELDFAQEANHQALFRRMVRKDRIGWADAPAVHNRLSGPRVLVTSFVEGVSCLDLLHATERRDGEALARYRAMDIDPDTVGRRVIEIGMWMRLEAPFFHADPHPGNIFIQPGNKLVFLDFGTCGFLSTSQRGDEFELNRRLISGDVPGATAVGLGTMAPLPDVDVPRLRRLAERVFWLRTIDLRSDQAHWFERTTASIWVALIEAFRDFKIPINLRTLRALRASLLYDTLAFRLSPDADLEEIWRAWLRGARKRQRRRTRREVLEKTRGLGDRVVNELDQMRESLERGAYVLDHFLRDVPREFVASSSKASFVFSSVLRGVGYLLLALTAGGAASIAYGLIEGEGLSGAVGLLLRLLSHPIAAIAFFLAVILLVSRIRAKLDEAE